MPCHRVTRQKQAHRSYIRSGITIIGVGIMGEGIMESLRETLYRFPSTQEESALDTTEAATILPFTAGQSMAGRFMADLSTISSDLSACPSGLCGSPPMVPRLWLVNETTSSPSTPCFSLNRKHFCQKPRDQPLVASAFGKETMIVMAWRSQAFLEVRRKTYFSPHD